MLGKKNRYKGYRAFVEHDVDDEIQTIYLRDNMPAVVGSDGFKRWLYDEKMHELEIEDRVAELPRDITMKEVTTEVARDYGETEKELRTVRRGARQGLESRKVAMYLCQCIAGAKLDEIADNFGLTH